MGANSSIPCGKQTYKYKPNGLHWCHIGDLVLYMDKLHIVVASHGYKQVIAYIVPMIHNTIDFSTIPDEPTMLKMLRKTKKTFVYLGVEDLSLIHSCFKKNWSECMNNIATYWTTIGIHFWSKHWDEQQVESSYND